MSAKYTPHFADPKGAVIARANVGIELASLAAAPTAAAAGYEKGCIFIDRSTGSVYRNTGTLASATWTPVGLGGQGAALTAQLTTITPADAAGTPDYAIAAVINSSAWGFASAQEAISVLYVIQNLQTRLAEVEARLEAAGIVAAN